MTPQPTPLARPDPTRRRRAPSGLGAAGRHLWRAILDEFDLDEPQQLAQLRIAADQADVIAACRATIATDGMFVPSRFDTVKTHPAVDVAERAARLQLAAIRALELDVADALAKGGY